MRSCAAILACFFFATAIHAADTSVFQAREALAKLQAMDIFPDMEKEGSEFANALSTEVGRLEREEPDFFKSPAWPLRAARRVADRMGLKPRSVAEIRKHVEKSFDLDAEAFQQVHGIQIVSARLSVGGDSLDVTPQMAARVTADGFTVDCDARLLAALAEESQFERNVDEKDADFWKRQRKLLAAVAEARAGQEALQIEFEFQSENFNASAKSGERIAISEEGKVSITKVAPVSRSVAGAVRNEKPSPTPVRKAPVAAAVEGKGEAPKPERRPMLPPSSINRR